MTAAGSEACQTRSLFLLLLGLLGLFRFLGFGAFHFLGLDEGLIHEGLHFGASAYANTFFVTTSFHGMHVFSGVVYLTVMTIRSAMGKYDNGNHDHIEILGLFWHFVDLVWILVFTFIYLIP